MCYLISQLYQVHVDWQDRSCCAVTGILLLVLANIRRGCPYWKGKETEDGVAGGSLAWNSKRSCYGHECPVDTSACRGQHVLSKYIFYCWFMVLIADGTWMLLCPKRFRRFFCVRVHFAKT